MLTATQHKEFKERGFTRLAGAFPADAAAEMIDRVWSSLGARFGISPTDPSSWKLPLGLGLRELKRKKLFQAVGSDTTVAALDALIGENRWQRPRDWGTILVTFPDPNASAWTVPRGWHTDWPYQRPAEGHRGALVFAFLSEVRPGQGGTSVVEGSPHLIRRFVDQRPRVAEEKMKVTRVALMNSDPWLKALASEEDSGDRVERFMHTPAQIGGTPVRVAELTGEPGDIVFGHPWLLHTGSPNCGDQPRFMRVQRIRGA